MCFQFVDTREQLFRFKQQGWIYFFLTQPQPNERQAFIKFGITKRTMTKRFNNYASYDLANIICIHIPNDQEQKQRESVLKDLFKWCMSCKVDIQLDRGNEFWKGELDLMLRLFLYVANKPTNEMEQLVKLPTHSNAQVWIRNLPLKETYTFELHTQPKRHRTIVDVSDILDRSSSMDSSENESNTSMSDDDISCLDFVCPICSRKCKDARGLTVHKNKCGLEKQDPTCEHCEVTFSCIKSLQRHYDACKILKEKKAKEQQEHFVSKEEQYKNRCYELEQLLSKVEDKNKELTREIETLKQKTGLKERRDLLNKYEKEIDQLKDMNHRLVKNNESLTASINDLVRRITLS